MSPGNASTPVMLPLGSLVLDPALQCRATVQDDVVASYADLLDEGAEFPPIDVIEADGQHLVTDGWHRVRAHERAKRAEIAVVVKPGTRRDALLAAVRANASHGLQRSTDDKRRAVRLLLADPEWCGMSSRDLAALAGVSHTFINLTRKRYGVKLEELLTDARIEQVDGEPPLVWRKLLAEASSWDRSYVEKIRIATEPGDLLGIAGDQHVLARARLQRRAELATDPWPWGEDTTQAARSARFRRLDDVDDLVAAVRSAACPDLSAGYLVLEAALALPRAERWALDNLQEALAGRPAFLQALEARAAELQARREADPWNQALRVQLDQDPDEQAETIATLSDEAIAKVKVRNLHPSVRDGAYRDRVAPGGAEPCAVPWCRGWIVPSTGWQRCVLCETNPDHWRQQARASMRMTAALLEETSKHGVRVSGVKVDRAAVDVLAWLEGARADDNLPEELRALVLTWRQATPEVLVDTDTGDDDEEDLDDRTPADDVAPADEGLPLGEVA